MLIARIHFFITPQVGKNSDPVTANPKKLQGYRKWDKGPGVPRSSGGSGVPKQVFRGTTFLFLYPFFFPSFNFPKPSFLFFPSAVISPPTIVSCIIYTPATIFCVFCDDFYLRQSPLLNFSPFSIVSNLKRFAI